MVAASAAVVLWSVALASGTPASQSSLSQSLPPATALIAGRVVDAASGSPIAGAVVTLSGGVVLPGTTAPPQPRAMTNGTGRFVFRRLLKGPFRLTATKAGYAEGAHGRRRPGASLALLPLAIGERVTDVVIPLWRYGLIAGTVSDEAGEPMVSVQVRVFQRRYVAGRPRFVEAGGGKTERSRSRIEPRELTGKVQDPAGHAADYTVILFPVHRDLWVPQSRRIQTTSVADDGSFSFRNLPPGDYQLSAQDDVEPNEWYDPVFLQRLSPTSIKLSIAEGEKKTQDIRIGGGG